MIGKLRHPGDTAMKRQLIISGHHDSAPENTWLRSSVLVFLSFGNLFYRGTTFVMSLIQLIGLIFGARAGCLGTLGWFLLVFP